MIPLLLFLLLARAGALTFCTDTAATLQPGASVSVATRSPYTDFMQCSLTVTGSQGTILTLRASSFSTEANYDFLYVYDGASSSASPLGGSPFSGVLAAFALTSTGPALTLRFTSDYSNVAAGVVMTVSASSSSAQLPSLSATNTPTPSAINRRALNYNLCRGGSQLQYYSLPVGGSVTIDSNPTSAYSSLTGPECILEVYLPFNSPNILRCSVTLFDIGASDYFYGIDGSFYTHTTASRLVTSTTTFFSTGPRLSLYLMKATSSGLRSGVVAVISDAGPAPSASSSNTPTSTVTPTSSRSGTSTSTRFTTPQSLYICGASALTLLPGGQIRVGTNPDAAQNYYNSMSCSVSITLPGSSNKLSVSFIAFATEPCCDTFSVLDGASPSAPVLFSGAGTTLPALLLASGSSVILRFSSDSSVTASGVIVAVADSGIAGAGSFSNTPTPSPTRTGTATPTGTASHTASNTPLPVQTLCAESSYYLGVGGTITFSTSAWGGAWRDYCVFTVTIPSGRSLSWTFLSFRLPGTRAGDFFSVHDDQASLSWGPYQGTMMSDSALSPQYSSSNTLRFTFAYYSPPWTGSIVVRVSDASIGSTTPSLSTSQSSSPTSTSTPSSTPSGTSSRTAPISVGFTFSSSPTPSNSDTPSNTPASATPTPTPTLTPSPTPTPSPTASFSPAPVCAAGSYLTLAASSPACQQCPPGTYSAATGATSPATCLSCPAGTASAVAGAASADACQACGVGYTATTARTAVCALCPPGFFPPSPSLPCAACAAGQAGGGGSACTVCPAGTWSAAGSWSCVPCPPGRASGSLGAQSIGACTPCAAGTASGAAGSQCAPCAPGRYASGAGSLTCAPCAPGQAASAQGSPACASVAAGSVAPAFSGSATAAGVAAACPAGSYARSASEACVQCPAGRSSGAVGAAGAGACAACGAGTYSAGAGALQCTPCPPGRWSSATGAASASACTACAQGSASAAAATSCSTCSTVSVFSGSPSSACPASCPPGYACDVPGAPSFVLPSLAISAGTGAAAPCAFSLAGGAVQTLYTNPPSTTYAPNDRRGCALQAPPGYTVALSFTAFQTEAQNDVFSVYRGNKELDSTYADRFSGRAAVPSSTFVTAFGGSLYAAFTSDNNLQYSGVAALLTLTECPAGSVCASGSAAGTATPCPAGRFSPSPGAYSADSCQPCAPGSSASAEGSWQCAPCSPGTFAPSSAASTCSPCPAGAWADTSGATQCAACGAGYFAPPGSSACTPCPAGTASSDPAAADVSACAQCAPGRYADAPAQAACLLCPAGTFSAASGASSSHQCALCTDGTGAAAAGSAACAPCAAGQWGSGGQCQPCPAGSASAATGAASFSACVPCPAGSATSAAASSSCAPCSAGRSAPTAGTALCLPAPPGAAFPQPGSTAAAAAPCAPGSFAALPGTSACTPCTPGTFAALAGALSCDVCAAGTTGSANLAGQNSAATACLPCQAGSFSAWQGAPAPGLCLPCGPGRYSAATGVRDASACSPCPAGTASSAFGGTSLTTCLACTPGTFAPAGSEACGQCPGGTYGTVAGATSAAACTPCPPGYVSLYPGATSAAVCQGCTPGRYSGAPPNNTVCAPCAAGSYSSAAAAPACTQCPPGRALPYAGGDSPSSCQVCPAGRHASPDASACALCPANTFQSLLGASDATLCLTCPAGKSAPRGSESCTSCKSGFVSTSGSLCTACTAGTQPSGDRTQCEACPRFRVSFDGTPCLACPVGVYCDGTETSQAQLQLQVCTTSDFGFNPCNGDSCQDGYDGKMCRECASNFYTSEETVGMERKPACKKCPNSYGLWLVLALAVNIVAALVILLLTESLTVTCPCLSFPINFGLRLRNSDCSFRGKGAVALTLSEKEKKKMDVLSIALSALWTRCVTLSNLNSIPFPQVLRDALSLLVSLVAAYLSYYPRCSIATFDFTSSWKIVIVTFFVSLPVSRVLDYVRDDKSYFTLNWVPLTWMFPLVFQYSLDAVTCNDAGNLYKDPSVRCQVLQGDTTAIGGFSIVFIIIGIVTKIYKAVRADTEGDSPEVVVFALLDIFRACMPPVSYIKPRNGAGLLFFFSLLQLLLCVAVEFYQFTWWNDGKISVEKRDNGKRSPIALLNNKHLAFISFTTITTEIVLLKVTFEGKYDTSGSWGVGLFLLALFLISFGWGLHSLLKICRAHKDEVWSIAGTIPHPTPSQPPAATVNPMHSNKHKQRGHK